MLEITDYGVPGLNTSGMVKTSANTLLPIPFANVQYGPGGWSRRTVGLCSHPRSFHRHPQPAALRGVSPRGYRHRNRSSRTVGLRAHLRSLTVLSPAYTTGHVMRVVPPWLSPSAPEHVSTTTAVVKDCAALHAPYCSGSGLGAQEGVMLHIVIGSHVNHLVDMACLTEFQKLENLIYLETGVQLVTLG